MQSADAEPHQDALLHPGVHMPSPITVFRGADLAMAQRLAKPLEGGMRLRDLMGPASGLKQPLDVFPQTCSGG